MIALLVILPFHLRAILQTNWETVTLTTVVSQLQTSHFLGSLLTALFVCLLIGGLFYRYRIDAIKQLQHRQKLARMILQNGWYEAEQVQNEGFFKDLPNSKSKERITHFPKMYYTLKDGLIHINVEITMGKYQDQLLRLEDKLETGLYCELVDKVLKESYVVYTLLYDTIGNRISIDEVTTKDGRLKLMDSVYWVYDSLPHMLIAGGTGSGKSYFILTIIEALLQTNAKLYILDPKNADLADLATVMPNVYYQTGQNYAALDLPANFLIFDEYVAFMDMLGRESLEVMSKLKQIVMLGRQAGFFLILACQRPDAKYLADGIRDQFNFRVALGRMSELGYSMMFGSDTQKQFFLKPIKGRGYVDVGTSVISEFYTPLVPKDHDFLGAIGQLATKMQAEPVSDEVQATGSD